MTVLEESKRTGSMEKQIKILHLEDDARDAELIQATLDSAGIVHKITRVQTAVEFSAALTQGGYDLILADYRLPGYDGLSALNFVREEYPTIPFIFVSGTLGEDAAIQALTEGATDYVLKQKLSRLAPAVVRALRDAENQAERRHAEETLRESEERFRAVANSANDGIISTDMQGIMLYWNKAAHAMFQYADEEILDQPLTVLMPEQFREEYQDVLKTWFTNYENHPLSKTVEAVGRRKDGSEFPIELSVGSWNTREGTFFTGIVRDITKRKRFELERESIIAVSKVLRKAATRAEILTATLDQLLDLFDAGGSMLALPNPVNGGVLIEMGRGDVGERFTGLNIPPKSGVSGWVIENRKSYLNNNANADPLFYRPDLLGDSHCIASVPLIAQEQAIGALWIARQSNIEEQDLRLLDAIADIAANAIHRTMLYEQDEQHLHRLIALHQIDLAISSNFDLSITFNVILNYVKSELEVDAVNILLLDSITHTLDYAAGIGFRTRGIEQSHVRLGEGHAGHAAQEYRTIACVDLSQSQGIFSRSTLLADEEFESHFAAPLTIKDQVKGVLEVFHRKPLQPDSGWLDYFETLATQAAIAIESASMVENLQRSNMELMLAYDATIEGWSRALDLRDKETEGHTQRVTDMALVLAEKMGLSETEKMNIWRGGLLHDIGKMGVPDSILLKPGSLSESEWEIMRQHPSYAYQMLSPITYLKNALEISYCHHEKWDGSGYPRGLKGEDIPLSARLFAVVDVFDALTSDRPYRKAWSHAEALCYIEEQSGKHFDPKIVKIFLKSKSQQMGGKNA